MSSGFATDEAIIGEVDGGGQGSTGRRHPKDGADEVNLSLHLSQVAGGFRRGFEICHGVAGEDGAVSDGGGEGSAVGEDSIGGGDEPLVVLKPDEDLPRLEFVEAVVEHAQRRFEPVRLLLRVGDVRREPRSAGVGVREEYPVAGLSLRKRRRCDQDEC